MSKQITNDEEYQKSINWLVDRAKMMEHPLINDEKRQEHMTKYNYVEKMVQEYNDKHFKSQYYPPLDEEEPQEEKPAISLGDWL